MRVKAIVLDFDGTLAPGGQPLRNRELARLLTQATEMGIPVIVLTGRNIDHVLGPTGIRQLSLVRRLTAILGENGAVAYFPKTDVTEELAPHLSHGLVSRIQRLKVPSTEVWADHCAIMTAAKWSSTVEMALHNLNRERRREHQPELDLEVQPNGEWVTYLPPGVNKLTGLMTVLERLHIDPADVLGFGDGTNDGVWLNRIGAPVALANAVLELKLIPHVTVTRGRDADGVVEVLRSVVRRGMIFEPPGHELTAFG